MLGGTVNNRKKWRSVLGNPGAFLEILIFLGAFFYCCWQCVDLRLIYHGGGVIANFPVFYWGWDFLQECLAKPGGMLNYGHALFSQCLTHSLAGPSAVTALALLLYLSQNMFLKRMGANRMRLLGYVPPLLLLGLISKYTFYTSATFAAFSLLAAFIAACAYAIIRPACFYLRTAWILVLGFSLHVAASEAMPVFFLLCLLLELQEGCWHMMTAFLLLSTIPFLSGRWLFDLSMPETMAGLFPFGLSGRPFKSAGLAMLHAFYLGLPVVLAVWVLAGGLIRLFFPSQGKTGTQRRNSHVLAESIEGQEIPSDKSSPHPEQSLKRGKFGPVLKWIAVTTIVAAGMGIVLRLSANAELKAVLEVDYYCHQKMWSQALKSATTVSNNIHVICEMNQALYHTGRLGDDLPLTQNAEALLLYDQKYRPDWNVIDIYLDLGFINMANHYLVEAVDIYGERPSLLRRLALVNAAIGNTGTARIYFNALKRVPFHAAWAKEYLHKMEGDPALAADEKVAALRQWMLKDNHVIPLPADKLMLKLLECNKHNRMAFEYFTAHCLLTKNIQGWIAQLSRLEDFNWGELPRYYQEAIVLAIRGLGLKAEIKNRRVGEQYVQRFESFVKSMKTYGADRAKAAEEMRKEYGDTYYYYFYLR